jgi:hypothetical protein
VEGGEIAAAGRPDGPPRDRDPLDEQADRLAEFFSGEVIR